VKAGLLAFNASVVGEEDKALPLAVFGRRTGNIVGGATGYTHWHWLYIRHLWGEVSDLARSCWARPKR
jgi:hypothetical protein